MTDHFKEWFLETMRDADGNYNHLPDWLEEDMRRAWDAALSVPAPGTGGAPQWFLDRQTPNKSDQQIEDELTGNAGLLCARELASEGLKSVASVKIGGSRPVSTPQGGDLGAGKVGLTSPEAIKNLIGMVRTEAAQWREQECYEPRDAVEEAGFLDVIANTLEALSSTPVGEMYGWQPIETAPKIDGKRIFIGIGKRLIEAWWDDGYAEFLAVGDGGVIRIGPNTRWHAYPQPPVSTTSPQGGR